MGLGDLLLLAGLVWVAMLLFSDAKKKEQSKKHNASGNSAGEPNAMAPQWLKHFALVPARVVNMVRVDYENYRLEDAADDVRKVALDCWEHGRCRTLEFAQFMSGRALEKDNRLYFARVRDGEVEPNWYAFVAPANWWRGELVNRSPFVK